MKIGMVVGVAAAIGLAGCSGGVSGVYKAKGGNASYESIAFSGSSVTLNAGEGKAMTGTFTADGDKVTITIPPGATETLTKDKDGCLVADMIGTYCK